MSWALERQLPVHVVLTKADKLSRGPAQSALRQVQRHYELVPDLVTVQTFSSLKRQGVDELILQLNRWLFQEFDDGGEI